MYTQDFQEFYCLSSKLDVPLTMFCNISSIWEKQSGVFSAVKSIMKQYKKSAILNNSTTSPHKWSSGGYGRRKILQLENFVSFCTHIPFKIPGLSILAGLLDEISLQINWMREFNFANVKMASLKARPYLVADVVYQLCFLSWFTYIILEDVKRLASSIPKNVYWVPTWCQVLL